MHFHQWKRREFITLLGGAAAWPLAARAQQGERMRRIGVLMAYAESDPEGQACVAAFREGLQKLGWAEGRNIRIDTRWATPDGGVEQAIRQGTRRAAARPHSYAKHAHHCGDAATNAHHPHHFRERCRSGRQRLRRELPRPGGNVTGFIDLEPTMAGKWLELLKEIAPRVTRVAFLFNPATAPLCRILPGPLQGRRCVLRRGGDRRTCSRHVRARIRHCRTGARAEWRPDRDAG